MKVYMNAEGQFLRFSEVSSHGPETVYYASWGNLNDASVVNDRHNIDEVKWKDSGYVPETVVELPAAELRVVKLLNARLHVELTAEESSDD